MERPSAESAAEAVVRTRGKRLGQAALAMVAFAVPVVLLAFAVRQQFDPLIRADQAAIDAATGVSRRHAMVPALLAVQEIGKPLNAYLVASGFAVWAWLARSLRGRAIWAGLTMGLGWTLEPLVKYLVHRVRPVVSEPLSHAPGFSFPSGHALNITLATSVTVVLLWPLLPALGRRVAVVLGAAVVLTVGLDRVFLGVHFPSDVIAGIVLGLGITVASWIGFVGRMVAVSLPGPSHPG